MILQIVVYLHLLFSKVKSNLALTMSFFFLLILAGFRTMNVGTDTVHYYTNFNYEKSGFREDIKEPLWLLLQGVVIKLDLDFQYFLVVISIFTLLPVYFSIRKESSWPLFSLFVFLTFYYYFFGFNIMRQCLAASWGLIAIAYYREEDSFFKNKKSLLFCLIASLFHTTGVLVFLMILSYLFLKKSKVNLYVIQFVSVFIGIVLGDRLLFLGLKLLSSYNGIEEKDAGSNIINLLVLNAVFIIINHFIRKRDRWFYFFFFFIILTNLVVKVPFGERLIMYAGVTLMIFFANLGEYLKIEKKYLPLAYFLIVCYCVFRFIRIFGSGEILPYENTLFL